MRLRDRGPASLLKDYAIISRMREQFSNLSLNCEEETRNGIVKPWLCTKACYPNEYAKEGYRSHRPFDSRVCFSELSPLLYLNVFLIINTNFQTPSTCRNCTNLHSWASSDKRRERLRKTNSFFPLLKLNFAYLIGYSKSRNCNDSRLQTSETRIYSVKTSTKLLG